MNLDAPFAALADPTRRAVYELVRQEPRAVGDLARLLPVSRPAVSQHLRVLAEADLVAAEAQGTRRVYHATPRGLEPIRRWLEAQWEDVLDAFADAARREHSS